MSKQIKYTLNDKQLEILESVYKNTKDKLPPNIDSFDKFIDHTIDIAIETHLQFASMNEKMMDLFDSTMKNMKGTSNSQFDIGNIDEFINNIFNSSVSDDKRKTNKKEAASTNKKDDDKDCPTNDEQWKNIKN